MAQHDYVIDNSTGANVRADINSVLQAISSNNSGSSAPSTTYALQSFANTTDSMLQLRNAANNAFVNLRKFDGSLPLPDGSVSSPSLFMSDDTNTGLFSSAADTLNFTTGGVERLELGAATIFNEDGADVDFRIEGDTEANLFCVDAGNNRIGIGTNTPNELLNIHGSGDTQLNISSDSDQFKISCFSNGDAGLETVGSFPIRFFTASSERARIDSSGRLLIGHSTVTPVDNDANNPIFQVEGTGADDSRISIRHNSTTAGNAASIYLSRSKGTSTGSKTSVADDDALGSLIFMGADGTHDTRGAIIQAEVDGAVGDNDMPARLVFMTTPDGGLNSVERMRVNSLGQVMFGCTDVTDSGSTVINNFQFSSDGNPTHVRDHVNMIFGASSNSADRHCMQLSQGRFNKSTFVSVHLNTGFTATHLLFYQGSSAIGSITTNGSSTSFNTSSDYRLKENATVISDGITRLKTLVPRRFNWKIDETNTPVDGFFAHEVTAVPEAVTGTKDQVATADDETNTLKEGDPIYQSIDQSKLVPLITAALQEAVEKIEVLETKVAALEGA